MNSEEIRQTYEQYGSDAFEMFDHDRIDNANVEIACGPEVGREYSSWVYFNLK